LGQHGIVLHTTPQARTRAAYEARPGCMNFGTCRVCPIGARYSPNYHLLRAIETGHCRVHSNTSVRRLVVDATGRARALVYQGNDDGTAREHGAKVIIIAAGTLESARLLLLSGSERHPDGLGNDGGHVGQHLTLHHLWSGSLHYKEHFQPSRFGGYTARSHQFLDPPSRGKHGGVVIDCSSQLFANYVTFHADVHTDRRVFERAAAVA
jgi:glucose dehydrogenase